MRRLRGFLLVGICILVVLLSGCASKKEKEAAKTEFLQWMFTSNLDGRYEKVLAHEDASTAMDKIEEEYYKDIKGKITQHVYEVITKKRMPYKFDEMTLGHDVEITDIKFSGDNFSAGLWFHTAEDKSALTSYIMYGVLETKEEDSVLKISGFKINDEADFWKRFSEGLEKAK